MTASTELMAMLHAEVANGLLERIKSGEATAAEYQAAIKFLKDNGIEALPSEGSPLHSLIGSLPFDSDSLQMN
jgi:hypothetical protein